MVTSGPCWPTGRVELILIVPAIVGVLAATPSGDATLVNATVDVVQIMDEQRHRSSAPPCAFTVDANPGMGAVRGGVACVRSGTSTATRFAKRHDLSIAFPPGEAILSCVEFGWSCSGGPLDVVVELHLDQDGGGPRPDGGDLELLRRQATTLPSATVGVVRLLLDEPVVVASDREVVVVLDVPASSDGIASFAGDIDAAADATWFTAPSCDIDEWRILDESTVPLDWYVRLHGRTDGDAPCSDCVFDCDGDGIGDLEEIAAGATDCNGDLIPDSCGGVLDCNANGVPDSCESDDCDGNGTPDLCDVLDGSVPDCDGNLVPDACDIADGGRDLDADGVLDCCVDPAIRCRPGPPDALDDATWVRVRRASSPPALVGQSLTRAGDAWLLVGGWWPDGEGVARAWRSSSDGWTFIPDGPPPRAEAAAAPLAGGALLFGGRSASQTFGDSWRFEAETGWAALELAGPPARSGHAMVPWNGGVLLFGGRDEQGKALGDVWWFDGEAWSALDVDAGPSSRWGHAMCLDLARGEVVLHGGVDGTGSNADTWSFDGARWLLEDAKSGPGGLEVGLASLPQTASMLAVKDGRAWMYRDARWHQWSVRGDEAEHGPAAGARVASEPGRNAARIVGGRYDLAGAPEVVLSATRHPARDCDDDFQEDHQQILDTPGSDCDLDGVLDACVDGAGCSVRQDVACDVQPSYGAAAQAPTTNYGWQLDSSPVVYSLWMRRFQIQPACASPDSIWVWWDPASFQSREARLAIFSDPDGDGRPYDARIVSERRIPRISGVAGWRRYEMPVASPGEPGGMFFVAVEILETTSGEDEPMSVARRDRLVGESGWVAASSQPFDLDRIDQSADLWPVVPLSTTTGSDAWFMIAAGCLSPRDLDGDFVPDECQPCPENLVGTTPFVDVFDLEQVLLAWGGDDPVVDLSGDGLVDAVDLARVLLAWGWCGD